MSETQTRKIAPETRVTIREAKATDAAVIATLYQSLVQDTHINVRPERLEAIAADPNTSLFVCDVDGVVCGTLLLTICLDAMLSMRDSPAAVKARTMQEGRRGCSTDV